MGKNRPVYGRFTRGLKPHESAKGEGFTPELWKAVDVKGKPILIEHDWRNPGAVGSFVRNWVEYDQATNEHWCCIEGEIDMEGPHGPRVVADIESGKLPAWSVSLIQSNPLLVQDVGSNREFLEGSLTNDPAETGTQVIVRHNNKGESVPVTTFPMKASLSPPAAAAPSSQQQQQQAPPAETAAADSTAVSKTETPAKSADTAAADASSPQQPIESQQKASDTLTKQEGQPVAPSSSEAASPTSSLAAHPVPPTNNTSMADTTANPNPTATAGNNTAGGSKTADGQQQPPPNAEVPKPNAAPKPKAKLAPPRKPEPAPEPTTEQADAEMNEDAEGVSEGEEEEEEAPPKKTPEPVKKPLQKEAEKKKEDTKKVAEPIKKAAPSQDAEMKDAPADTKAPENPVKDALSKFAAADPKNAEVVVSLLSQLNELKSESAKLREERAAEKAERAAEKAERDAEKARVEQARLKEASAKHEYWAKNIDSLVPDVSAEEKDMVKQIFESDHNELGNKTLERLIDRLTEALATTREEAVQHKKSRASSEASPHSLSEDQLKSALEQLSKEFGGGTPKQPVDDTEVKRKKSVTLKEPSASLPRTPGPNEIVVRHSKALNSLDAKSATAKALMAFGDRTDLDINGHHAMLAKKIDEVRARKAQLNA